MAKHLLPFVHVLSIPYFELCLVYKCCSIACIRRITNGYIIGEEAPIVEWEYFPHVGSRPARGFVGLKNAGATCYMNSVLQQVRL